MPVSYDVPRLKVRFSILCNTHRSSILHLVWFFHNT